MNLAQRLQKIQQLEQIEVPWEVKRVFGPVSLFGAQVNIGVDTDVVSEDQAKIALQWLVEQFNGKVKWGKNDTNS